MKIYAKKSLGQNFLKDENILKKIAFSVTPREEDLVIEIGPGKGALTKYLVNLPAYYLAFEIDERMKKILSSLTNNVIYQDFLKVNLLEVLKDIKYRDIYVVANIPYYITTPIIEHLISSGLCISQMTLLVQKEVAIRFCAKPHTKDFGYFTVYLNYYFHVSKLFDVSRNCFDPVPNVDSSVVCFTKKERKNGLNEQEYFKFLKVCFSNKRKTLKNNLQNYNWTICQKVLDFYGYSSQVRAEELEFEVFEELFIALGL